MNPTLNTPDTMNPTQNTADPMNPTQIADNNLFFYDSDKDRWMRKIGNGRVASWCRDCDKKLKECVC